MLQIPGNVIFWVLLLVILLSVGTIFLSQNQILFAKAETLFSSLNRYSTVVLQKCSDGTIYNLCSSTKPKYCDDGNLVNKCFQCGCPSGTCQADGSCKISGDCDFQCKLQSFASGTCEAGTGGTGGTAEFSVCGNRICKNGVPWEWRGTDKMSVFGGNPSDVKSWGMDIVRECIDMKLTSLDRLQEMADDARQNDMVVIFGGFWYDSDALPGGTVAYPYSQLGCLGRIPSQDSRFSAVQARWREIATRFKDYPNVWFNPWNEPYDWQYATPDAQWLSDAALFVDNIRSTGATNIIILNGDHMGQGWQILISAGPQLLAGRQNVAFDIHTYNNLWNIPTADVENRFQALLNADVPFLVGEFGAPGDGTAETYTNIIAAMISKRVTGLPWVWHDISKDPIFEAAIRNWAAGTRNQGTSTTTSSTANCQSGETSIGQDGCSSGLCCCSGVATCDYQCKAKNYEYGTCLSGGAGGFNPPLHADGKYLKDANNNIVYLRGTDTWTFSQAPGGIWNNKWIWTYSQWDKLLIRDELQAMKSWGINVIRIQMPADYWIDDTENHRTMVKDFLNMAAEYDIYVIYDAQTVLNSGILWEKWEKSYLPYPPYVGPKGTVYMTNEDAFIAYWYSVATELKDYPNAIFELWNEPGCGLPSGELAAAKQSWFSVEQRAINTIRETGAKQPIIVEWWCASTVDLDNNVFNAMDWITQANLNDLLNNLIYSDHMYNTPPIMEHVKGCWQSDNLGLCWKYEDLIKAYQQMKLDWVVNTLNKPLIIGEIGVNLKDTGTLLQHELAWFDNSLDIFNKWGISYISFAWCRQSGTHDWNLATSGSPSYTPSQTGQILISRINDPNYAQSTVTPSSCSGMSIDQDGCSSGICCCSPSYVTTLPTGELSKLHVEGNKIKDNLGNTVYLRGVDYAGYTGYTHGKWHPQGGTLSDYGWQYMPQSIIDNLNVMRTWGINCIRLQLTIRFWVENTENYKTQLKEMVGLAAERGIYIIYDSQVTSVHYPYYQDPLPYAPYLNQQGAQHDLDASIMPNRQAFVNYWTSVANELKGYDNVIFEIFNEPQYPIDEYFTMAQQVINAIRSTGAQNLIVVDGPGWATVYSDLSYPQKQTGSKSGTMYWVWDYPLNDPLGNLVYSVHNYRMYEQFIYSTPTRFAVWSYDDILKAFDNTYMLDVAKEHPVFIGEFSADSQQKYDFNNAAEWQRELEYAKNMMRVSNENGIHWTYMCWAQYPYIPNHDILFYPSNWIPPPNEAGQLIVDAIAAGR